VLDRIRGDGVVSEEIYQAGNRLFMILRTTDEFSLDAKVAADGESAVMQDWEELMWKYQRALPFAPAGTKWVCLEKIFEIRTNGHDPNSGSSAEA
jgi:L-rhamnose mutarotase